MSSTSCYGLGTEANLYYVNGITALASPFGLDAAPSSTTSATYCEGMCLDGANNTIEQYCFSGDSIVALEPVTGQAAAQPFSAYATYGFGYPGIMSQDPVNTAGQYLSVPYNACAGNLQCMGGIVGNGVEQSNCCTTNVGAYMSSTSYLSSASLLATCTDSARTTTGCVPCVQGSTPVAVGQLRALNTSNPYVTFYQCLPVAFNVSIANVADDNCDFTNPATSLSYSLENDIGIPVASGTVRNRGQPAVQVLMTPGDLLMLSASAECCCVGRHNQSVSASISHTQLWQAVINHNQQNPSAPVAIADLTVLTQFEGKPACRGSVDTSCGNGSLSITINCSGAGSTCPITFSQPALTFSSALVEA